MRTGILGGTFDPIHIAHLHTAECARYQLHLDRVLIMPAGDPWQKSNRFVSPVAHRLEMCRLAVKGVEGIEVDDRETRREGATYTIDTLETFPPDEELFLILGADSAAGLQTWHRWEEVMERARIAVAPRPGAEMPDIPGSVEIAMGLLELSGVEIRTRARTGRPYRYLVTEPVYDYIETENLYDNLPDDDMVVTLRETEDSS